MRVLKVIYVLAVAAALIALVIVGIYAFYSAPEYPDCYQLLGPQPDYDTPGYEDWQQTCNQIQEAYGRDAAAHDRNVFLIALPLGTVFAVAGTFIQKRRGVFGAGLILGGIGTMLFAVTLCDLDEIPVFIGIAVILAVLIFVGFKFFPALRKS
jgi:lipopolysaccharide export LptBFGC system permease protein LptF